MPVKKRNKPRMYNQYILLRNKKQSGPYNYKDLLQLNIQPFDLIWIQGRSTAWQTADEVSELKNIITPLNYLLSPSPARAEINSTPVKEDRFTSSLSSAISSHIYVQLPLMINLSMTEQTVKKDSEQPMQMITNHANIYNHEISAAKQEEVYNHKSLEQIRNEYASWLNQQKPSPKKSMLNKLYLTFIYSVIVSALSLFWKQSKPESSIEKHLSFQPAKGAKGVV